MSSRASSPIKRKAVSRLPAAREPQHRTKAESAQYTHLAKASLRCLDLERIEPSPLLDARLGGFGAPPLRGAEDIYVTLLGRNNKSGGGTGSVTTKRELGLTVTDFFDYTNDFAAAGANQFVTTYIWDVAQNLFDTDPSQAGSANDTFCRIRKLCVWVLPTCRTFGGTGTNNAESMFTVNCQVPGTSTQFLGSTATAQAFATNTQVTNVLPMIDTKWKKVLTADLQRTFQSGVIRPVFQPHNITNQAVFSMSIVHPTTGKAYQDGDDVPPIRVKVQLIIDQPIGTFNTAKLGVYQNEEFALPFQGQNGADFTDTTEQYVQVDLKSVRDNMS